MFDIAKFFDHCRREPNGQPGVMGPTLDNDEVSGAEAIIKAMDKLPIAWVAYALATAWHETAHTMQPIKEYGGNRYFTRMYDVQGRRPSLARRHGNTSPGDGAKYPGRGYVQLTWKDNYIKADKVCADAGLIKPGELNGNPDLAMRPDIAAHIMRDGMWQGWFTGRSFQSFLPAAGQANYQQFKSARRIINGTDKWTLIAKYAVDFQEALCAGGWEY